MAKRIRYKRDDKGNLMSNRFQGKDASYYIVITPIKSVFLYKALHTSQPFEARLCYSLYQAKSTAKKLLQEHGVAFENESRVSKKQKELLSEQT